MSHSKFPSPAVITLRLVGVVEVVVVVVVVEVVVEVLVVVVMHYTFDLNVSKQSFPTTTATNY